MVSKLLIFKKRKHKIKGNTVPSIIQSYKSTLFFVLSSSNSWSIIITSLLSRASESSFTELSTTSFLQVDSDFLLVVSESSVSSWNYGSVYYSFIDNSCHFISRVLNTFNTNKDQLNWQNYLISAACLCSKEIHLQI